MSNLRFEVLLATMNQKDDSVLDSMRLESDAVVCNQIAGNFSNCEYEKNNYKVRWFNFNEKGVGLNRNNALMRSEADICLLADDDVVFESGYKEVVLQAFENKPEADVIVFNIHCNDKPRYIIKKTHRVNRLNCGRYGAVRIAFRRRRIIKNNIFFSLLFGGGAEFPSGEDTLFLVDCLRKKLKVFAVPQYILSLDDESESSWFKGYDSSFFEGVGISSACQYGKLAFPLSVLAIIKRKKMYLQKYPFLKAVKDIKRGIKKYKKY